MLSEVVTVIRVDFDLPFFQDVILVWQRLSLMSSGTVTRNHASMERALCLNIRVSRHVGLLRCRHTT